MAHIHTSIVVLDDDDDDVLNTFMTKPLICESQTKQTDRGPVSRMNNWMFSFLFHDIFTMTS